MRLMCCELTMPGRNSWNGEYSGERNRYIKILRVSNKSQLVAGDYSYAFSDGLRANVEVTEITGEQSRRLRKASAGFCGYDWMVDEIRFHGRKRGRADMTPPVQTYIDTDAIPRHRRTDPETSVAAAKAVTESGKASAQAREALRALLRYGPCSTRTLADLWRRYNAFGIDRYAIARRMPELERLGLVRRTDKRDSGGIVWEAVK